MTKTARIARYTGGEGGKPKESRPQMTNNLSRFEFRHIFFSLFTVSFMQSGLPMKRNKSNAGSRSTFRCSFYNVIYTTKCYIIFTDTNVILYSTTEII